jgi:hypothetical protein
LQLIRLYGAVEFALSVVLCYLFWKSGLQKRFPAMQAYLVLRSVTAPILSLLLVGQGSLHQLPAWAVNGCKVGYFIFYFAAYIASAILLFFVCFEVFRSTLCALQGLALVGTVMFRWTVFACLVLSIATTSFSHKGLMVLSDVSNALMRAVSILELCLLAVLCLSVGAIKLSVRDMSFGIALGLGIMSSNDFIASFLISHYPSMTLLLQTVYQSLVLIVLGIWIAYVLMLEPAYQPAIPKVHASIYRWNEIASYLGKTGTQIATPQPVGDLFLGDEETVVDRVNAKEKDTP